MKIGKLGIAGLLLLMCLAVQSQTGSISASFSNASLLQAITTLEKQYNLTIAYDPRVLIPYTVNVQLKNATLSQAIYRLLAGTDLVFLCQSDKEVLIRKHLASTELPAAAPVYQTIRGQVLDQVTGQPLSYANVFIPPAYGDDTDENGWFDIRIPLPPQASASKRTPETLQPEPKHILQVSYIGYHTSSIPVSADAVERTVKVRLVPTVSAISRVTVTAPIPGVYAGKTQSVHRLTNNQIDPSVLAIGTPDVLRAVQMLPGVQANDDSNVGLRIRGAESSQSLVMYDYIPLYDVDHFFGLFSVINPGVVEDLTLYKSAVPLDQGGTTAGMLNIQTINPLATPAGGAVELSRLTSSVYGHFPVGKNHGFTLSGRITNTNLAETNLFQLTTQSPQTRVLATDAKSKAEREQISTIPDYRFYDWSAKWVWQINEKNHFQASFFSGYDEFENIIQREVERSVRPLMRTKFIDEIEQTAHWKNGGLSLALTQQWSAALQTRWIVAIPKTSSYYGLEALHIRQDKRIDTLWWNQQYTNSLKGISIRNVSEWKASTEHLFQWGLEYQQQSADVSLKLRERDVLRLSPEAVTWSLFGMYRFTHNGWDASLGLRPEVFQSPLGTVAPFFISPRLQIAKRIGSSFSVSGSAGVYRQTMRQWQHEDLFGRSYDFWVLADGNRFPAILSSHVTLGGSWSNAVWTAQVDGFYRHDDGVLENSAFKSNVDSVGKTPPSGQDIILIKGEGQTRGIDFLLSGQWPKHALWVAYTLSKSTYSFPGINRGVSFPSHLDSRHQVKGQYEWAVTDRFRVYGVGVYASGRPYTDVSKLSENGGSKGDLEASQWQSLLPDYKRIDLGLQYEIPVRKSTLQLEASVFNVFDWTNTKYVQYFYTIPNNQRSVGVMKPPATTVVGTEMNLLGRTYNLSATWSF